MEKKLHPIQRCYYSHYYYTPNKISPANFFINEINVLFFTATNFNEKKEAKKNTGKKSFVQPSNLILLISNCVICDLITGVPAEYAKKKG
jgi:hypothetical protein